MMTRFWTGYILFFIFIFPMIFEYTSMIGRAGGLSRYSSPWAAIVYLAVGAVAWLFFILWYYRWFVKPLVLEVKNVAKILREGKSVTARVEKKLIKMEKVEYQSLQLELSFKNLAGTPVLISYEINDTKPEMKRYEVGKSVTMRLDPQLRPPAILPENIKTSRNAQHIRAYFGLIALIFFCIAYLLFSYWLQSNGYGWRFLHFWHPWVTIPFWGLFLGWIVWEVLIDKLLARYTGSSNSEQELVFKGKLAQAHLINSEQTGTYINEQPQIRFEIEFADDRGQQHRATLEQVVSLLDLHKVSQKDHVVLYLPNDPKKVMMAEGFIVI